MWPALIVGATCLAGLVFAGQHIASRLVQARIAPRHRDLQYVLENRRAPEYWRDPKDHLVRLDGLADYIVRTRLVADEATRSILQEELQSIRADWIRRD